MTRAYMKIRSFRYILGPSSRYNEAQNYVCRLPNTMAWLSQCFYSTNTLKQKKRNKDKDHNQNRYKKFATMEIYEDTTIVDVIKKYGLTPNSVQHVLSDLEWKINPYRNVIYKDKKMFFQFLKKLKIPFTYIDLNKEETKKEISQYFRKPPDPSVLVPRPPIITVMGHVDHGKTTLLDTLRKTAVAASEEGGITQRIGVFNVNLGEKMWATVLDTPGHAAFSTMRERGAFVTDIIILVVAADDGVMNQTKDVIRLASETNTPLIVAINKIDKPNANIERTQQMLAKHGVLVEQLNGDVQCVEISALNGTNLDRLIEAIELQAKLQEPQGDPTGRIEGYIIETSVHPNLGKSATVLVQRGTLKTGAILLTKEAMTKVKFMHNYLGESVSKAGLSEAVQISGWKVLPNAGEKVYEVESIKIANIILKHKEKEDIIDTDKSIEPDESSSVEETELSNSEDKIPEYNIIIKADSVGSVEAITGLLNTYTEHDKCVLSVVHSDIGNVTPNDINLAKTFNATIYCFNTTVPKNLEKEIDESKVELRTCNVIYNLMNTIKEELVKKYPVVDVEEVTGQAEVLQIYTAHEKKTKIEIAGCKCTKGTILKSGTYRVIRAETVVDTGEIKSLRHLKNDVTEINKGDECGIRLSNGNFQFQIGDTVICYKKVAKVPECNWNLDG